jgi:hypothetical protein
MHDAETLAMEEQRRRTAEDGNRAQRRAPAPSVGAVAALLGGAGFARPFPIPPGYVERAEWEPEKKARDKTGRRRKSRSLGSRR